MTRAGKNGGPLVIGLTGSIGMGKSTVADMLRRADVPVFDADAQVRRLQSPNGALLPVIEAAFPGSTGPQGLDRDYLGRLVFADPQALARLEALVHPALDAERQAFFQQHADADIVALDIPLLLETGGQNAVDVVLVVSTTAAQQRERVLRRPGMTEAKFSDILARQMPDAQKRALADHVIDTSGTLQETERQLHMLLACLRAETGA